MQIKIAANYDFIFKNVPWH